MEASEPSTLPSELTALCDGAVDESNTTAQKPPHCSSGFVSFVRSSGEVPSEENLVQDISQGSAIIRLNVGGTLFTTTRATLCRGYGSGGNNFFSSMISGRIPAKLYDFPFSIHAFPLTYFFPYQR